MPIIQGLLLGFGTAFLLGPVFFTLLKNALKFGKIAGIATALGIVFSDIVVILICFIATAPLIESIKTEPLVKILGSSILLIMGIRLIFWPAENYEGSSSTANNSFKNHLKCFVQGFLVNGVNPFVFVVWIGFVSIGQSKYDQSDLLFFITSILSGIFLTDILKSIFASRILPYLAPKYLKKAYFIIGILLLSFAARLLALVFL